MKNLVECLIKHKSQSALQELDLQKCGLTSDSIVMLAKLIALKQKIRILNLKSNGVGDEAA